MEVLKPLLEYGAVGILAIIALYFAWRKDQEVKSLYEKMIEREEKRSIREQEMLSELSQTVKVMMRHHDEEK